MMNLVLSAVVHRERQALGKIHRQPLALFRRRQRIRYPIDSSIYSASSEQN